MCTFFIRRIVARVVDESLCALLKAFLYCINKRVCSARHYILERGVCVKKEGFAYRMAWSTTSWWGKVSLLIVSVFHFPAVLSSEGKTSAVAGLTSTAHSIAGTAKKKIKRYARELYPLVYLLLPILAWAVLGFLCLCISFVGGRLLYRWHKMLTAEQCDIGQSSLHSLWGDDKALLLISLGMDRLSSNALHTAGLLAIAKAEIYRTRGYTSSAHEWASRAYSYAQSAERAGQKKQAIRIYRKCAPFVGHDAIVRAEMLASELGVHDQQLKMSA